jgi:hypothetical protein
VWTSGVLPLDPLSDGGASFSEAGEVLEPDAILLETPKEALDEAILLGRIGCNEFLVQRVIGASGAKAPALEDDAVIAANCRG